MNIINVNDTWDLDVVRWGKLRYAFIDTHTQTHTHTHKHIYIHIHM